MGIRKVKLSETQVQNIFKELLLLQRLKDAEVKNPYENKMEIVKNRMLTPCENCTHTVSKTEFQNHLRCQETPQEKKKKEAMTLAQYIVRFCSFIAPN